jgi:DNA-binding beta-propeller fold protein YncE
MSIACIGVVVLGGFRLRAGAGAQPSRVEIPEYRVDPFWPKALPKNWILAEVSGVAVDPRDHVWIVTRPNTLTDKDGPPPTSVCCTPAPPVVEFDSDGNVVRAWGASGEGYEWPAREHGISVDYENNVWVTGSGGKDHIVLKFTPAGTFLLQLGRRGVTRGGNDVETLGGPTQATVDREANEVYVADGEGGNRRVIVFDAKTGAYKRRWNAYGTQTTEGRGPGYDPGAPPSREFGGSVHCVRIARDGLVYVCDRQNNRIQVFRKDGTYLDEIVIAKETRLIGSVWDIGFSLDQKFLLVADGSNQKIWIVERTPLRLVGSFGRAGHSAGQLLWTNGIALDSKGDLFTAEVTGGNRVQKFVPVRAPGQAQR